MGKIARYDDTARVSRLMKHLNRLKLTAERSPYTGMMTLLVYTLWKDYRFSQAKLSEFCTKMLEYDAEWVNKDFKELNNKLMDYAGWDVDCKKITRKDYPASRSKFENQIYEDIVRYDNLINEQSVRYFIYGYNVCIDLGFGAKKLTNYMNKVSQHLDKTSQTEGGVGIMELWKELVDGAGIYIEKPDLT